MAHPKRGCKYRCVHPCVYNLTCPFALMWLPRRKGLLLKSSSKPYSLSYFNCVCVCGLSHCTLFCNGKEEPYTAINPRFLRSSKRKGFVFSTACVAPAPEEGTERELQSSYLIQVNSCYRSLQFFNKRAQFSNHDLWCLPPQRSEKMFCGYYFK